MNKDISLDKPIAGAEFSSGTIRLFYLAFSTKKNFCANKLWNEQKVISKSMLKVNVGFKFLSLWLKISKCIYLLSKVSNVKAYSELSANV